MLTPAPGARVYLAVAATDLRRGHDGLCALVRGALELDPYAGHLFAFVGKRGDRLKILFWDRGGFVVYYNVFRRDGSRCLGFPTKPTAACSTEPSLRCCSAAST
jgi:transposase